MYQLIYVSSAKKIMSTEALKELLTKAREKNTAKHITGMLLYFDGNFLQLMEGEEQDIHHLFDVIQQDPQHTGIITVDEGPVSARLFSDWSMGFRETSMTEINTIPGYKDITAKDFLHNVAENDGYALDILKTFRDNMLV